MANYGIICEYNPFHLGHYHQINSLRQADPNCGIVCIMSGNFVQRGMPAIIDKSYRAQAAIACGADLVLELPITAVLSSAENFAAEGVRLLTGVCDYLSFGAEDPDVILLQKTAQALLSDEYRIHLHDHLTTGSSFPAARQKALEALGLPTGFLAKPNNILAIEYCKAILQQNSDLKPVPIHRKGSYHDRSPDLVAPSASSIRILMEQEQNWLSYVPDCCRKVFEDAPIHALEYGERAILAKLRTMSNAEFEALPFGSEGLWRKLMANARSEKNLEDIIASTKSKRYTRSRLDRMVMCAFLGIDQKLLTSPAPYARILALNKAGRNILVEARKIRNYPNIGQKLDDPYQILENRVDSLYGLFAKDCPDNPDVASKRRIYYVEK